MAWLAVSFSVECRNIILLSNRRPCLFCALLYRGGPPVSECRSGLSDSKGSLSLWNKHGSEITLQ